MGRQVQFQIMCPECRMSGTITLALYPPSEFWIVGLDLLHLSDCRQG